MKSIKNTLLLLLLTIPNIPSQVYALNCPYGCYEDRENGVCRSANDEIFCVPWEPPPVISIHDMTQYSEPAEFSKAIENELDSLSFLLGSLCEDGTESMPEACEMLGVVSLYDRNTKNEKIKPFQRSCSLGSRKGCKYVDIVGRIHDNDDLKSLESYIRSHATYDEGMLWDAGIEAYRCKILFGSADISMTGYGSQRKSDGNNFEFCRDKTYALKNASQRMEMYINSQYTIEEKDKKTGYIRFRRLEHKNPNWNYSSFEHFCNDKTSYPYGGLCWPSSH